ncbi:MAG: VacJ family lipoprotein [Myxococcota bacterium]
MAGVRHSKVRHLVAALVALSCVLGAGVASAEDEDPWEGFNRKIYRFNEGADKYVIGPVAKGWNFLLPDQVELAIDRFFENIRFPIRFLNDLLQAKPLAAAEDLGRFVINSSIGLAGFFDPASKLGIKGHNEDFGQTLGYWGVPPGPYLVLPILGPSSPRHTSGRIVDSAAAVYPYFTFLWVPVAVTATDMLNYRALIEETLTAEREAALDFYVFQRNAYMQHRENLVRDREEDESSDGDLYQLD